MVLHSFLFCVGHDRFVRVYEEKKLFAVARRDSRKEDRFVDVFFATLSPSIAQISLMGTLFVFLGAWIIIFLMLALRSTSQQPVDAQQERVRPASWTHMASNREASQDADGAEEVAQIAS